MEVYQEGQKAFSTGMPCPYSDWRSGTWKKGFDAAAEYHASLLVEPPVEEAPPENVMVSVADLRWWQQEVYELGSQGPLYESMSKYLENI